MSHDNSNRSQGELCRRQFLRLAGLGAIGLGFGVSIMRQGLAIAGEAPPLPAERAGTALGEAQRLLERAERNYRDLPINEITPNDDFYLTSYGPTPRLDGRTWRLRVEGLVERPSSFALSDITPLLDKTAAVTLACIGNPVGGNSIGNAVWEGVTLKRLLEPLGPKPGLVKVVFYGAEGYVDSIPAEMAMDGEVFLAWRMNGQALPVEHGYPLRAVTPGIYGMKNVKWLEKIELVNFDFQGYWEKRGWSDTAEVLTLSQILLPPEGRGLQPGSHVLGGIAYAGRRGVAKVEISTDDGQSWREAQIKPPLSPFAWRLWRHEWRAESPGVYSLHVRATDGQGRVQESAGLLARSYPDGARGIHAISVEVK